jgi:transposase
MGGAKVFVGLDIGADTSVACMTDALGVVMTEASIVTSCQGVLDFVVCRPTNNELEIGLEAGSMGILLARRLREQGYQVRLFGTRQASQFLKIRQNKTDTNDARGIADILRIGRGVVPDVHLKSAAIQQLRSQLVLRQKLVTHRVSGEGAINSVFRLNGGRLRTSRSGTGLQRHVQAELQRLREIEDIDLAPDVEPLLDICVATRRHLESLDRRLAKQAKNIPVCARFMEIPGVGPITALSFYTAIEDPWRFRRNGDVGAYLGLVPKIKQSGSVIKRHGISKMGNRLTRSHLAIAAGTMLRQSRIECAMRAWAFGLIPRIGKRKAKTALSRKLAVVMLSMWKSDTSFQTYPTLPLSIAPIETSPLSAQ